MIGTVRVAGTYKHSNAQISKRLKWLSIDRLENNIYWLLIELTYLEGGNIFLHACLHRVLPGDGTGYLSSTGLLDNSMVSMGPSLNMDGIC